MKKKLLLFVLSAALLGGCDFNVESLAFWKHKITDEINKNDEENNKYNSDFFLNYRISLNGAQNGTSEADKLTSNIYKIMNSNKAELESALSEFMENYSSICGEKFFLAYVSKDCSNCADAKEAFSYFKDNLLPKGDEFHLVTIFGDEEKYSDSQPEDTLFYNYCLQHQDFFECVASIAYETAYYCKGYISDSDLDALQEGDNTLILTPTIFLVELGDDVEYKGVTEVMVGIPGDGKYEKAQQLADCWNHTGDFSIEENYEK